MPRKLRMYLPDIPCHVVQRGNNRSASFFLPDDYRFYIQCLIEAGKKYHVALHSYVLMTNHAHLLLTPETSEGPGLLMKHLGQRYVQ